MKVTYDDTFYAAMHNANLASARVVVPLVLGVVGKIESVVDVGCGRGLWLKAFEENGVSSVFGVDGSWVQKEDLVISHDSFEVRDFEKPFSVGRTADLAVSLEVAEHVSPEHAQAFVDALIAVAPVVLFSAAVPGQGGTDHRNEQWPSYWAERFAQHGYVPVDALRRHVWSNPSVSFFYAQNIMLFVKKENTSDYPTLELEYKNGFGVAQSLVHPFLFSAVLEDAIRWKGVVPYINWLPLRFIKIIKPFLVRKRV